MIIIFIMIIVFWQLMLEFKVELVMVVFFKNSEMYFALEINPWRFPLTENNDESEPHSSSVPFVFFADDAFQLSSYCMKPYGRKYMTMRSEYLIIVYLENIY